MSSSVIEPMLAMPARLRSSLYLLLKTNDQALLQCIQIFSDPTSGSHWLMVARASGQASFGSGVDDFRYFKIINEGRRQRFN